MTINLCAMQVYKFFLLLCLEFYLAHTQVNIPIALQECYRNYTTNGFHLPLNLHTLLDIIRKAETYASTTMDIRTISSSLLHKFKFDGIEHSENIQEKEGILPFIGSGPQRVKHELIKELVPGIADDFPYEALTHIERCTLHHAISNTIDLYKPENANIPCQQNEKHVKINGKTTLIDTWDCPKEQGVILTPYGTVALGAVIGAIAASLQPQGVTLKELLATSNITYTNEVDFVLPNDQMAIGKSMWQQSINASSTILDNVWLTTIAGDLAEMVIYQGPYQKTGSKMDLGATGFWNSTIYPTTYYLIGKNNYFDATRAEIIGDIDGFIIARNLQEWTVNFHSLRLSQILDMYYSDNGINFDSNIKACERKRSFQNIAPETLLEEQVLAVSQILGLRNSAAYISDSALRRMVGYATNAFLSYTNDHLFNELLCHNNTFKPQIEIIIAFDGTWSKEYTMNFISVLIEDLDVSMYGSKIGILHSMTGDWLLNVTNSPAVAYEAISNFINIAWPLQFNFTRSLEAIFVYLNNALDKNQKKHIIGNLGQAIVLLAPLAQISDKDQQSAITLLHKIKYDYPDVHFLYYTSQHNAHVFKPFILSEEDHLIQNSSIDDITNYLSRVPRALRPIVDINLNMTKGLKNQMEEYVNPLQSITYRFHSRWRRNTKKSTVSIHAVGYGAMKLCYWSQNKLTKKEEDVYCKEISDHKDITLINSQLCTDEEPCSDIYYRIQDVTSLYKCTEIQCKSPNQVRYIIRIENVFYKNSTNRNILLIVPLIFYLFLINILN